LDAAANTAAFGIATSGERAKFGDDVSWLATDSQIAMAALIGSAFRDSVTSLMVADLVIGAGPG
jgi:hypothetical protein